jgi:hypothetical protein
MKFGQHIIFAFCFSLFCSGIVLLVMMLGAPAMGRFLGDVHTVPMQLLLLLLKIPWLWGLGTGLYCFLVFCQWFTVGLAVSFFFPKKK